MVIDSARGQPWTLRVAWWMALLAPLVVAVVVILVIWPGLMPDVGYWDTGEFQTVLPLLGTAHPTGYPTYVLIGFVVNLLLTPLGEPAFRMNVLSLLCVAVAAGATVRLVMQLTGWLPIAIAAGVGLALTPATWRLATHADPHTLHLALVAILLVVLVRWEQARTAAKTGADRWLVIASVVFGLAVGNHSLTLLLALPVGLFVLSVEPRILTRGRFMATLVLALVGTIVAVYLELPLRAGPFRAPLVYGRPDTWDGFWYIALAEQFRGSLHDPLGGLPAKLGELGQLASTQFGILAPAIPIAFLATAVRQRRYALLTGSAMLITLVFNASYSNADISRYYLGPTLWAWSWLAILGAIALDEAVFVGRGDPSRATFATSDEAGEQPDAPPAIPASAISASAVTATARLDRRLGTILAVVLAGVMLLPTAGGIGIRAEVADSSHDTAARRWVTTVLADVAPDAVVVSWWSTSTVLWYAQFVDHLRPDISVIDDRTRLDLKYGAATDVITRFLGLRPVYVIRANARDLQLVLNAFELELVTGQGGTAVYRVIGPRGTDG